MTRDDYLREVDLGLRDLPWRQRRELLADLRNHLAELPPETNLSATLGSPYTYAADLRTAAGLHQTHGVIAFIRSVRPRKLVATVLAVTVIVTAVGLAIGGVVWIDTYQPLSNPGGVSLPPGKSLTGLDGVQAKFQAGRPFYLGVLVHNNGPFTVRVLGVPWDSPGSPWKARLMMSQPHVSTGGVSGPLVPFHPVDLAPDHDFFLRFTGVYTCRAPEDSVALVYTDFPVRYSFLWRTATTKIPLGERLAIYFPKAACK